MSLIGQFLPPESLQCEYKEFKFHALMGDLSEKEARQMVERIDLQSWSEPIQTILTHYIDKYLPKYVVSFANCQKIDYGEFYLGVSDEGEITGFPIVDVTQARKLIVQKIATISEEYARQVQIEFLPLSYEPAIFEDTFQSTLAYYQNKYQQHQQKQKAHAEAKRAWLERIFVYKQSINQFSNLEHHRACIIDYVETSDLIDSTTKAALVARLRDPTPFFFETGEIPQIKYDVTNIAYWIVTYRDRKCAEIAQEKPINEVESHCEKPYRSVLRDYRPLIAQVWAKIPLYLIKITLPGQWPNGLSYWKNDRWWYSYRTVNVHNQPMCL